ncbi:hypothetical protein PMIN01_12847 [Paraphaeosphaeria minitans]|uniref:Uncharacterized protein n=1 Tax=Paraphaeosphaeria minitans TaxID=565426 RepID=A0A9P6KJV4_9PLEO|nr:hypothetical protein PMIN01_12847 [Paraphaeosphaeria minitans]
MLRAGRDAVTSSRRQPPSESGPCFVRVSSYLRLSINLGTGGTRSIVAHGLLRTVPRKSISTLITYRTSPFRNGIPFPGQVHLSYAVSLEPLGLLDRDNRWRPQARPGRPSAATSRLEKPARRHAGRRGCFFPGTLRGPRARGYPRFLLHIASDKRSNNLIPHVPRTGAPRAGQMHATSAQAGARSFSSALGIAPRSESFASRFREPQSSGACKS